MKIREEHLYHGAVLNQIAEHEQFTAINALKLGAKTSRSAFKVNNDIAVYLKYASKPVGKYKEYQFTFNLAHLRELNKIADSGHTLFVALVCVKAAEICCLPYDKLMGLIQSRRAQIRGEDQYSILVTLKAREAFRVYINTPGTKGSTINDPLKIRRNACPNDLFR